MCPLCLASLAVTVATTASAGAAVAALTARVVGQARKSGPPSTHAPKEPS